MEYGLQDMAGVKEYDLTDEEEFTEKLREYSGKWLNLTFLHSGKIYKGYYDHDTEDIARQAHEGLVAESEIDLKEGLHPTFEFRCGTEVPYIEISHAIPMPVK